MRPSSADVKTVRGDRNAEYISSAKCRGVLAALDEVAADTGTALATVALAWTKAQPGLTAPSPAPPAWRKRGN